MKNKLLAVAVLVGLSSVSMARAQGQTPASKGGQTVSEQDIQLLRQDVRSKKKQIVAANLRLTDVEATKFWPVYDQYTAEVTKLSDQRYELTKDYARGFGSLTDEQALSLINRALALDEALAQLRIKYVPIVNKVLPGTKTATFFQIDRRLTGIIDLQLASEIPLVQQQ
jgi:hypothetical protein